MQIHSLKDFTNWWIIWNFNPTLLSTDLFEVAIKNYNIWDSELSHHHKIATEYTIINNWVFRMNKKSYNSGDIIIMYPWESTDFECIVAWSITVIKVPCVRNDKFIE